MNKTNNMNKHTSTCISICTCVMNSVSVIFNKYIGKSKSHQNNILLFTDIAYSSVQYCCTAMCVFVFFTSFMLLCNIQIQYFIKYNQKKKYYQRLIAHITIPGK